MVPITHIALLLLGFSAATFTASLMLKRNDIADIAWGIGFILVAFYCWLYRGYSIDTSLYIFLATFVWGTRLSTHIALRHMQSNEDKRYSEMSRLWGNLFYLKSYLYIFLFQSFLIGIISMPFYFPYGNSWWLITLGIFIFFCGFLTETIADYQLSVFVNDPQNNGHLLTTGLWRYSRHPNYFGEVLLWWGIYLMSLPTNWWYITLLGPTTITCLILFVSGIPLLEKSMKNHVEFEEYKNRTSIFIPRPPRRKI